MNKDIVRILRVGGTPPDLYAAQRIEALEEHLMACETERDWLQADFKLITDACRAAGWQRNNHNHPTTGDDIAAFITSRGRKTNER